MEKNFIGVKFIASTLQVRKANEEICRLLQSKDMKIGKKYTERIHILDVISLALYLPPVMNMWNLLLQSKRRYQRNNQQKN